MKCWKCGNSLTSGAAFCQVCGAAQARMRPSTDVGKKLRKLFDWYGAEEILTCSDRIRNGLGGRGEELRKARSLLLLSMDAGIGQMAFVQLQDVGHSDWDFRQRITRRMIDEVGLNEKTALQLADLLDEMIGWEKAPEKAPEKPPEKHPEGPPIKPPKKQRKHAPEEKKPVRRSQKYTKILAIDLGGSMARAALIEGGSVSLVPNPNGGFGRPCLVGVRKNRVLVCEDAQNHAIRHPEDTAASFKRRMGGDRLFQLGDMAFTPQLLTALVLRRLRKDAEDYLGGDPTEAIITVPNSYTSLQRKAVIDAARMAGLQVKRLLNNCSAAVLDIGVQRPGEHTYLICDLGSSSFDVSVICAGDGVAEVLASAGDTGLGGDQFTECIVNWMLDQFLQAEKIDLSKNPESLARVRQAAETAKKDLSELQWTRIFIPSIAVREGQVLHLEQTLTRSVFHQASAFLRERARGMLQDVVGDAGLSPMDIEQVFFVGGGSRMPAMQDTIRQILGKDLQPVESPEDAVARGAAVQAGVLNGDVKNVLLLETTAHSLGIETAGGVFTKMIPRNTTYPTARNQTFSTLADNQASIDIHLLEGEREKASENESFGHFQIRNIPPAAKGVPRFDVSVGIDGNGVLSVTVKDGATGACRELTAEDRKGLREEQIRAGISQVEQIASAWEA